MNQTSKTEQPPGEWMAVEINGHRRHVGLVREVSRFGATFMQVDELQRDGKFLRHHYGHGAIFSFRAVTEEQCRRQVLPKSWAACDAFRPAPFLPTACEDCGFDEAKHTPAVPKLTAGERVRDHSEDADDNLTIDLGGGATEDAAIGRFWGLFNVNSEGEPLVLFPAKGEAERYLKQRQAEDPEGDDYLSQDWTVLRVDAVLSVLNSVDEDPFPEPTWPPRFTVHTAAELRERRAEPAEAAEDDDLPFDPEPPT